MKSIRPPFLVLVLAGLLSLASAPARAQSMSDSVPKDAAPAGASSFNSYDSNGDGKISQDEFLAQGGGDMLFAEIDVNQDKSLSSEEFSKQGKSSAKRY